MQIHTEVCIYQLLWKGVSEVMKKMRMKSLLKMTFSLILSMIMAVMMNITAMAVVIDVSSHDGLIDWNSVDEHIEGVIIRIGYGSDYVSQDDKQAIRNIDACEDLVYHMEYIYTVTHLTCRMLSRR